MAVFLFDADFFGEDFFDADFLDADFLVADFFEADFFDAAFLDFDLLAAFFFFGTLAPSSRASESPIAMACFLLVTFLPLRPLFKVPALRSCIARSTFLAAFFEYLAIRLLLSE